MIRCIFARINSQISEFETVWNQNVQALMLAACTRFVLPTDAAPDWVGAFGFTDGAAVFAALLAMIGKHLKPEHRAAAEAGPEAPARGGIILAMKLI